MISSLFFRCSRIDLLTTVYFCRILQLEEEDVYFYKKRDKLKVKHVEKPFYSSKSSSKKAKGQEIESEESSVAETEIDSEGNLRPSSKMPKSSITVAPKSSSIKSQERKTKRKKTKDFEVEEKNKKEKSIASNSIRSSKAPKSLRSSSSSSKAPKSNSEKDDFHDDESSKDEQKSSKTPKGKKEMMTRSKEELVRENLLLREIVNKYRDDVHELTRMQNNDPRVLLDYVVESVLEGLESKLLEINN